MIRYVKGPPPPRLTELAATPDMTWDGLGAADRDPLRAALVRDQASLCAYCQRRIKADRSRIKIEHWIARSASTEHHLTWSNLLGVCLGEADAEPSPRSEVHRAPTNRKELHCDTSRGDRALFLHPVQGQGPDPIAHLRYTKDGRVEAEAQDGQARVRADIETLNLNAWRLVRGRKAILDALWKRLTRAGFEVGQLRKQEQAHRVTAGTEAPEYAEFVRFHLRKKLRQLGEPDLAPQR
jgi:uncharacterized protein (TIGR02646 family)